MLARHRAVDVVRSELRRVARQELHYRLAPAQRHPSPCEMVMNAATADLVRDAVRLLPDGQLRVLSSSGFLMAYDDPVGLARELAAFCG